MSILFTEILNIAGQRHNAKMFETEIQKASGTSREKDEQAARDILHLMGLNPSELLENIGEIESALYDDVRDEDTRFERIERACNNLRYMITNTIGE